MASKVKTCEEIGFKSTLVRLDEDISEFKLLNIIAELNGDPDIDGILVQLPLPKHISDEEVINALDPSKDVDGFHPISVGKLVQGLPTFVAATPMASCLSWSTIKLKQKANML
ncbi:tetrahydrofolate dehydrogenase/cyclohydrolase catalytic domain-containing protein [Paraflavitalea speifideaquila]|uniref:tetrahydrofolate dehydrogenase/cyclohydrolase catalytic domain-containing protein n=1 Tax=Paraflavitalea speifideaquila TaxID=3076558 RepID=UPI0028E5680D|nr:tetrahydrofolate dehydrogenase/cyclohydrolase catalytic domain-containing protein [Paraflavitalea speifideiaquila]